MANSPDRPLVLKYEMKNMVEMTGYKDEVPIYLRNLVSIQQAIGVNHLRKNAIFIVS
jgi:hypothetical protein